MLLKAVRITSPSQLGSAMSAGTLIPGLMPMSVHRKIALALHSNLYQVFNMQMMPPPLSY